MRVTGGALFEPQMNANEREYSRVMFQSESELRLGHITAGKTLKNHE
ncbi:MAG: hypothetical protein R3225_08635 [Halofilum sp. (in: g-proteobacteria)]|nr:hypothetical protein [Halofilum sp. (in: g-proteobacteria)]